MGRHDLRRQVRCGWSQKLCDGGDLIKRIIHPLDDSGNRSILGSCILDLQERVNTSIFNWWAAISNVRLNKPWNPEVEGVNTRRHLTKHGILQLVQHRITPQGTRLRADGGQTSLAVK